MTPRLPGRHRVEDTASRDGAHEADGAAPENEPMYSVSLSHGLAKFCDAKLTEVGVRLLHREPQKTQRLKPTS